MKIEIYNFSATQKGFDWSNLNQYATTIMLTLSKKEKQEFWVKYFEKQIRIWKLMNCEKNIEMLDSNADLYISFALPENINGKEYLQTLIFQGFTHAYNNTFDTKNNFIMTTPKFWDKPFMTAELCPQYQTIGSTDRNHSQKPIISF